LAGGDGDGEDEEKDDEESEKFFGGGLRERMWYTNIIPEAAATCK
jgi:hypothetical protein